MKAFKIYKIIKRKYKTNHNNKLFIKTQKKETFKIKNIKIPDFHPDRDIYKDQRRLACRPVWRLNLNTYRSRYWQSVIVVVWFVGFFI